MHLRTDDARVITFTAGSTSRNLPLDGFDVLAALQAGGSASPRQEIPVNIGACGPDANGTQSIVNGPQAAMIVGELKLIVPCFWRSERNLTEAQLYNLSADAAEEHDLARARPDDVARLATRLAWWEAQSVDPYAMHAKDASCGEGKPHGNPKAWSPWC